MKRWVKKLWISDPSIPVTFIALIIITAMCSVYYFIIDKNFGSSLSFAVTAAAFFIALMIFRIQIYTKPLCSLFIEPQILDPNYHDYAYRIVISLNIDNVGQSTLKSKVLDWTVSEEMKINQTLHKVSKSSTDSWGTGLREIPKHGTHSVELFYLYPITNSQEYQQELENFNTKNKFYNSSTKVLVEIENHGFIIKQIFGNINVYFSSEEVQAAIDNTLMRINDSFRTPVPIVNRMKVERVWQYQSRVDRPPLG